MWLLVMFDLPVETRENRRDYRRFVDKMEDDGYTRVQFSIYVRPCATDENTLVHESRLLNWLPPLGEVRILKFTDKQWARMQVYRERVVAENERAPEQFTFFDEDQICEEHLAESPSMVAVVPKKDQTPSKRISPTTENVVAGALIRMASRAKTPNRKTKKPTKRNATPSFDFFD